jgi:uncharacterized protein (DUF1778 family)
MGLSDKKTDYIGFRVSSKVKEELQKRADKAGKSLTDYLVDVGLSSNIDTAKAEFYTSINDRLLYVQRTEYVNTMMLKLIANVLVAQSSDPNSSLKDVLDYYDNVVKEAEFKFRD